MAEKKCIGLFGELLGHKYKPVIEETWPESTLKLEQSSGVIEQMLYSEDKRRVLTKYIEAHTPMSEKVVAIMCSRCGDILPL